MKKTILGLFLLLPLIGLEAQNSRFYLSQGGELIFSTANVTTLPPGATDIVNVNANTRFTFFFHFQENIHFDITQNIGLYSGVAIRNVGFRLEDQARYLGYTAPANPDENLLIQHRSYALGFPLALKLGSFDNNFYIFGGAEFEWMFHYKQKRFDDGGKHIYKGWTDDRVNSWIPSALVGVQFPYGFYVKFKYYLDDFLNPDFVGLDPVGETVDFSQFQQSTMWYISVGWNINNREIKKAMQGEGYQRSASL